MIGHFFSAADCTTIIAMIFFESSVFDAAGSRLKRRTEKWVAAITCSKYVCRKSSFIRIYIYIYSSIYLYLYIYFYTCTFIIRLVITYYYVSPFNLVCTPSLVQVTPLVDIRHIIIFNIKTFKQCSTSTIYDYSIIVYLSFNTR